jgi:hypothetical protein
MKAHYSVHKSPPLESNLSQLNPIHTLSTYYFKKHCNVVPSYASALLRFTDRTLSLFSHFPNRATYQPSYPFQFKHLKLNGSSEKIMNILCRKYPPFSLSFLA